MRSAVNPACKPFMSVWLPFLRCSWRSSSETVCPIAAPSPVFWARLIRQAWRHYGPCFRRISWPEPRSALHLVGVFDRQGQHWLLVDVDATKQAARQRALPQTPELPAPHRRFEQVCAKGYFGRKRGQVGRTRTTVLQPFTHQWMGTFAGPGNGDYREELRHALQAITAYATAFALPLSHVIVRLDGLYGNTAPLKGLLSSQCGVIGRSKEYSWLDLPAVQTRLQSPPDAQVTHPESGTVRDLYDCLAVPLTAAGPVVRLLVGTHPAGDHRPAIGVVRQETVYELFYTTLPPHAFTASDVLQIYLHRGSFETVLS